jgi:ABC-type Fe3+-siderophore transport system permease subunit
MLRSRIFGIVTPLAGIIGALFLLLFDVFTSLFPGVFEAVMLFALIGGPLSLLWDVLIAIKFLRIGFRE